MNVETDDRALLQRYAETGCEEAFATLVARYVDHVYSVAYRECANQHHAEELTQVAFIILARKARSLSRDTVLSGWLFQTVRYAARNSRRSEQRRQRHEQEVASMANDDHNDFALWEQISPLLNDALAALGHADRDAIMLRFFEKKSHAEIAAVLHSNEAAVRKRLSRAIERLRAGLARRGVAVPAVALFGLLMTHSVQAAPPLVAIGVTAMATTSVSTSTLATSTLKLMAMSKLKIAGAVGAALLVVGGTALMFPLTHGNQPRSRTLSDGSTFTITHLDMASQVTYRYQAPLNIWQTTATKLLPDSVLPRFMKVRSTGSMGLSSVDGVETLFVGTAHEDRPSNARIDIGRVQVEGEDGSLFDGVFAAGTIGFMSEKFQAWRLHAFPRRGRNLTLRFFYADPAGHWAKAAEMAVPNPVTGPFPNWKPDRLPITRTNGDLVVSLVEFESGVPQKSGDDSVSKFWRGLPGTHCAFTLQQAGKAVPPWAVRSLQVSDATGNQWSQSDLVSWADSEGSPLLHTSMIGALWASEPAWNLRLELSRTNDFIADELITFSNLPAPKPGESVELHESRFVNEVSVDVAAIGAVDAELPSRYKWLVNKGRMNLAVSALGDMERKRVSLVAVRDDQGRAVPFDDERGLHDRSELVFGFQAEPDARSLSVTFAVHDSRFVVFRAKPIHATTVARD